MELYSLEGLLIQIDPGVMRSLSYDNQGIVRGTLLQDLRRSDQIVWFHHLTLSNIGERVTQAPLDCACKEHDRAIKVQMPDKDVVISYHVDKKVKDKPLICRIVSLKLSPPGDQ